MLIFATQSSEYLEDGLLAALHGTSTSIERRKFPNGEHYLRITDPTPIDLVGKSAVIIANLITDGDILEAQRLGYALAKAGTAKRLIIIPYLAYSTMEVARLPGEIVTAKTNAHMLSNLPGAENNTFLFFDLHEPSLKHYFEGSTRVTELSAIPLLANAIKKEKISDPILGSADLGMPQQIKTLAQLLGYDVALVSKSRQFTHTAVLAAVGNVQDRNVIIYDDMIRSGGSLIKAARAYKNAGAKNIWVAVSHYAAPNDGVIKKLRAAPIERIITTDSHPATQRAVIKRTQFVSVLNITSSVAKAAKKLIG